MSEDKTIAGAIYDFAGFLTTLEDFISIGSTENASIMIELISEWAEKRNLNIDDADVSGWNTRVEEG